MSFLFRGASRSASGQMIPPRPAGIKGKTVTAASALRQSAVWAAQDLRAGLISSFPIDTFRKVAGLQVEVPKPPVLIAPSGEDMSIAEWMYATQYDLDRAGNCYGIIAEVDGAGRPRRIDLVSHEDVTVLVKDGVVSYTIKGKPYTRAEIWHERQYVIPGLAVGLSPIAHAAWSLGLWSSAAEFAADWFSNHGMIPNGHLRNTSKTLTATEADAVKARFKVAVEGGDMFVTGNDWELKTGGAPAADMRFLEQQEVSDREAARFFGVPGDMIDVSTKGSSVTYANITQRNLQFLITKLGPAVQRRENALSSLLSPSRFVKLNTSAILRMDPETQSRILINEIQGFLTAPSEARAYLNRAPFTPEQLREFADLGIIGSGTPAPAINVSTGGSS
ncbi:phage portal protein [Microbacterium sp. BWR-S6Y]|uniref:phage portal protein n=1 Tax=Microbacterium sp. BWR-S6Y TaxID=3232073 RepID=UPI003528DC7E